MVQANQSLDPEMIKPFQASIQEVADAIPDGGTDWEWRTVEPFGENRSKSFVRSMDFNRISEDDYYFGYIKGMNEDNGYDVMPEFDDKGVVLIIGAETTTKDPHGAYESIDLHVHESGRIDFHDFPSEVTRQEVFGFLVDELPKFAGHAVAQYKKAKDDIEAKKAATAAKLEADRVELKTLLVDPHFGELESHTETTLEELLGESLDSERLATLNKYALEPRYQQRVSDDAVVYFSRAFESGSRSYVMAYALKDEDCTPQLLYTSKSQSSWRWAPGYDKETGWYCKGQDEAALNVVEPLQKSLYSIESQELENMDKAELKDIMSIDQIVAPVAKGEPSTYPRMAQNFHTTKFDYNDASLQPDFTSLTSTFRRDDSLYGDMVMDTFASNDGKWSYSFGRSTEGLAWLARASSNDTKLRLKGLVPDTYMKLPHDLGAPAYEYSKHAVHTYRGFLLSSNEHPVHTNYVNHFEALTGNTILQQFYATIPRDELDFMKDVPDHIPPSVYLYLAKGRMERYGLTRSPQTVYSREIKNKLYEILHTGNVHPQENQAYMNTLNLLAKMANPATEENSAEKTDEVEIEPIRPGTPEYAGYVEAFQILQFEPTHTTHEKYDPDVSYQYMSSPLFDVGQLIVTTRNSNIIHINTLINK